MILTDLIVPDTIVHILQVQDYLRDLDNWTKQMEKKDEQLKQAKKKALSEETSKSREASPPKRSKKTEVSKEKGDQEKHPNVIKMDTGPVKIKGSDYAAWDKFDVEAACEEVEKDIEEEEYRASERRRIIEDGKFFAVNQKNVHLQRRRKSSTKVIELKTFTGHCPLPNA